MMRALIIAAALLAASPAMADDTPGKPSTDAKPVVRIDGDTLTYIGGIAAAGTDSADIDAFFDEAVPTLERLIVQEAAFYERIGIPNDSFTVCGVGDRFESRLTGDQLGWGFSIASMARLGPYEKDPAFQRSLIQLTPENCKP